MKRTSLITFGISVLLLALTSPAGLAQQEAAEVGDLDARVSHFLQEQENDWRDMNVPMADGQVLYDLIIENGFTSALEIGTSTGHSAIWIAWALSKTGGKLITIEINARRYNQAQEYFDEAGLSDYIDIRLADAHELVAELEGPFDFVFVDADKDWYSNYFRDVLPNLTDDACFTAHNVTMRGMDSFLADVENTPGFETEIIRASRSGVSVSCRAGTG
jgi:predicted O-methyltransferase YrrM